MAKRKTDTWSPLLLVRVPRPMRRQLTQRARARGWDLSRYVRAALRRQLLEEKPR